MRKLSKARGVAGVITWQRIVEIGQQLEKDGILERKNKQNRIVAKGYYGRYDLLDMVYLPKAQPVFESVGAGDDGAGTEPWALCVADTSGAGSNGCDHVGSCDGHDGGDNPPSWFERAFSGVSLDAFAYEPYMHKRNGLRFLSVRKWRSDTKSQAMALLLEWKRTCAPNVVNLIATEIADAIQRDYALHGPSVAVCNPPIGGSGTDASQHFATLIAQHVASRLGAVWFDAFEPRAHDRGHSPQMKAMGDMEPLRRREGAPKPTVVLVDDVATSGTTMREALTLLQDANGVMTVLGIVWIAGEKKSVTVQESD